ncbi:hypothetical protein ACF0H5_013220 [Mactra antiquata]
MGTGQSLEVVDDNNLSDINSGYQSDILAEVPKVKTMAKPALRSRPSVIIGAVTKELQDREKELESEILRNSPGLKKVFNGFQECLDFVRDISKRKEKYYESLEKLLQVKIVEPFSEYSKDEVRMVMANKLAAINFIEPLVDYYIYLYDELEIDGVTNAFVEETHGAALDDNDDIEHGFPLILTIREILWNYSDGSHTFSQKISETTLFESLVQDLQKIYQEGLQDFQTCPDLFAFYSSVGILHNCARNPDIEKDKFRKVDAPEALYPFLKCETVYIKMVTMLAIGNIVTEDEMSKLAHDVHVIDFLHESILKAVKTSERQEHGFHLTELVDGLATIAQSDKTKKEIMMKKDLLPTILTIIEGKNTHEILACVKLVWELSFLSENKEMLKNDKKLIATLKTLRNSSDYDLKSAVNSVWFILFDQDERKKPDKKVNEVKGPKKKSQHIMISYCWGDKENVLRIYEILNKEGYRLWIDVHNMAQYTNILDGMAQAIEDAYAVIICFSEKYKNSQNCRTEANYVFQLQKKIVPLKMQRGYKPDGWLGILIGARLYIEFSPHYDFDTQMGKLRENLSEEHTNDDEIVAPKTVATATATATSSVHQISNSNAVKWTKKEVDEWIKRNKLEHVTSKMLKRVTGEHIDFLYRVMLKSPDTYYRWLESKLELKTLDDLMNVDRAIQSLRPN